MGVLGALVVFLVALGLAAFLPALLAALPFLLAFGSFLEPADGWVCWAWATVDSMVLVLWMGFGPDFLGVVSEVVVWTAVCWAGCSADFGVALVVFLVGVLEAPALVIFLLTKVGEKGGSG